MSTFSAEVNSLVNEVSRLLSWSLVNNQDMEPVNREMMNFAGQMGSLNERPDSTTIVEKHGSRVWRSRLKMKII